MLKKSKYIILGSLFFASTLAASEFNLRSSGVDIKYDDQTVTIKRMHDEECKTINGADPKNIWSGNYAKEGLPEKCVKKFVTTVGKITPMKINDKIETIGELEVIKFIKESQTDKNKLLIDARLPDWFLQMSIPTAENIPFPYFNKDKYPDDFYDVLDMIGVKELSEGKYDFTNAKELLLFCNGPWCPQSTLAIKNLIKIGFPQEKIKWYRGGMYSWKMLNLTTVSE
ncbi:rhodanese-like domain-containing protein [Halarcobacter anaerophilus]|jgi:rhodanese-related sulfurtransferase|uniref:Rhodanese-like domain-containing protein n=1 Tax=Halarcobacter anaerophilus TaxID=877500 RepID=A0A4Q0Y225_9BACT|nr:rhodanese-like domain-containing protein [Halarcobacter anaerophilus]QDF29095.1 rhodanese-like domain-containing protein [Halarcobacter anaerophilus]RXJ63723.1 rhodanese-like domain-containing protein [Halarcobacter anaerophilus]